MGQFPCALFFCMKIPPPIFSINIYKFLCQYSSIPQNNVIDLCKFYCRLRKTVICYNNNLI